MTEPVWRRKLREALEEAPLVADERHMVLEMVQRFVDYNTVQGVSGD